MSVDYRRTTERPLLTDSIDTFNEKQEVLREFAGMNVMLLGIPGAGKTTLVHELQERGPDVNYISLGDISRSLPADSPERRELDRLFALGSPEGIPEFFCQLVEPYIDDALERGSGFVLDGIPKKVEEIDPLINFLASKGVSIDMVVSCETPTLTAYDRVANRASREGDPDRFEIFVNRTRRYLEGIDTFKERLSDGSNIPLIVIDTEENSPEEGAARVLDQVASILDGRRFEADKREFEAKLYEAVKSGDEHAVIALVATDFDDTLPEISHAMLCGEEMSPEQKLAFVEDALAMQDAQLRNTPHFLKRLAENYLGTTFASLEHLSGSLIEEAHNRFGEDYTVEDVCSIFEQQRELKRVIEQFQEMIVGDKNMSDLLAEELAVNSTELSHIQEILRERAQVLGMDPEEVDVQKLMALQPQLWGQLTSNQVLFTKDYNYRRSSNGVPGSHHSLLPFTRNKRALTATSMGEYVPFIEAVSATEYKYGSTFGFIHLMGMDDSGEAYGVEYPIMMHDRRLIDLNNETVNEILTSMESFYGNHDLWHNFIPVYADHFILHHPHAPLSYGGRLPNYTQFGKAMREEKEEYEIGVAMSHARTQQERFARDPELRSQQAEAVLGALDKVPLLRTDLEGQCNPSEIEDIIDYLASAASKKAFNVFRPGDPIFEEIEERLDKIGVPALTVSAGEIATLLWKQGLIDRGALKSDLGLTGQSDEQIVGQIAQNDAVSRRALQYVSREQGEKESGAEHIVAALESWGAIESVRQEGRVELTGMEKIRWLAATAPQREQLKGHMEKVHGKPGYVFGDELLDDARDLVLFQYEALKKDQNDYAYRVSARSENQRLGYKAYSLIFDDGQDLYQGERELIRHLLNDEDAAVRMATKDAVGGFDRVMDSLVTTEYDVPDSQLAMLRGYALMVNRLPVEGVSGTAAAINELVDTYERLRENEQAYQQRLGRSYSEAEKYLLEEQMTIA